MGFLGSCLAAATVLLAAASARAATERELLREPRSVVALRTQAPIVLDGVLDEPVWAAAPIAEAFMQERPSPGDPARLRTMFRVAYDDAALYVGVRLEDPEPWAIQAPLGRRDDENSSDWCFVEIDSRRDRRTAFSLGVNPAGVQVDGVFLDDTDYDASWNGVWQAVTRIDASGWTAEYRIPFAVLAFAPPVAGEPMRWGINVYRSNPRTGESSNWSPRMPSLAGVVSLFNELVVAGAPQVRRLEITPYALLQAERAAGAASGSAMRAGVDANIGITPSVGAAITVLPDFGQVEADPTQLNLTTFELFQQERRPFFTEGIDAFRFDTSLGLVTRDDSFTEEGAFYTRRIGRAPEGDVPAGAQAPLASDILGAAKLFGRSASGWRAGVLAAVTGGADATGAGGDTRVAAPAEAAVARVAREAPSGDAQIGLFASALHRQVDGALADQLTRDAGAAGIDGRIRWADQTYEARGWVMATDQLGSAAAIARLAAQPWHNFLRVDAPRLRLADGATHMAGTAGQLRLAKVGGDLQGSASLRAISPGFDVNGLGFQRNSDWLVIAGQWQYTGYLQGSWLRRWQIGTDNAGLGWSWGGERRAAVLDAVARIDTAGYWDATLTLQREFSVLSTEWLRGGPALALPPRELAKLSAHTDTRRLSYAGLDAAAMIEPGSGSRSATVTPSLTLRLSDHIAGTLGASYQDQIVGWQLVAGPGVAPPDTYLVGRLHQRTVSLSLQADLAISPQLIIQLYAQPFATVGRYSRYAELADPRAARPEDRFAELAADQLRGDAAMLTIAGSPAWTLPRPDTAERTLIASAVARWELAPGSFLTAVWNHRGDTTAIATRHLHSELGDALAQPGSDILLLKLGWRWAP